MRRSIVLVFVPAVLLLYCQLSDAQWRLPPGAPLLTKWSMELAKEVQQDSLEGIQTDFQRLVMVRHEKLDLKGRWQFATAGFAEGPPFSDAMKKTVVLFPSRTAPSPPVDSVLVQWFRRTIVLPKGWQDRRVLLRFGELDWVQVVYVNQRPLPPSWSAGGYARSGIDITDMLKKKGPLEIIIGFRRTTDEEMHARGRKPLTPDRRWYAPVAKLEPSLWLEPIRYDHFADLLIAPDVADKRIRLTVSCSGQMSGRVVRAILLDKGKKLAETQTQAKPYWESGAKLEIALESPKLSSAGNPHFYRLRVELLKDSLILDAAESRFGLEKTKSLPRMVHAEYPRPQLVRNEWMNLNGLWQFGPTWPPMTPSDSKQDTIPKSARQKETYGKILVPFPIESALSGVMMSTHQSWYQRTFTVPESWRNRRVILHFGAVDWRSVVSVNGRMVGTHTGGYDPFSFDITDKLKKGGPQDLTVAVTDPTDSGDQPRGKQVLKPGGIWYTPTTGIWQTVWLEPVPQDYITELSSIPDVDGRSIRFKVQNSDRTSKPFVQVTILDNGKAVASRKGRVGEEIRIPIRSPKLWSPSHPYLYDAKLELLHGDPFVDTVRTYFGMRKVEVAPDRRGINRILLNGKFIMEVGPLDQGFWPDGIYTAPSDVAMRSDLEMMKKLGFNMVRKHVKVEPDRWYYWADKLGLLVWQDMPSGNNKTDGSKKQFESELERLVETHRNHPSIIMWVVFNEGWGQYDTERLCAWVKSLDPTRLVNNASGWTDQKVGDVSDIHNYPVPKAPQPDSSRAIVLGEFGGLGLAIDGHTWKKEHWGYQGMADREQLTSRYEKFMKRVYELRDNPGLSAAVYTQLTDVEVECNGLLTYDRAIVKPDLERIAAVNRGDFSKIPPEPIVRVVVPTSEEQGRPWRYTTEKPSEDWHSPGFDDAAWKQGDGGFGTKGTPGAIVRSEWKTSGIWLRTEVMLPDRKLQSPHLRIHHDEDAEIYVNGTLAGTFGGYTTEYEESPLTEAGQQALKPGKNTIAVHCKQTGGGQYIDVGIVELLPPKPKK